MPLPSLRGSVIQGSFPHGVPRHWNAGQAPPPLPPARGTVQPFQAQRPAPGPTPPPIQRMANGSAVQLPTGLALLGGTIGQKLPPAVQAKMESLFGASFEDVRVHVGPQAAKVGALAFTHGTDIYFSPHSYNPATRQGQQLLAHELTHVVQQRAGRARNPFGSGLAILQDHSLEAEADRMGRKAASAEVQPRIAPRPAVQPRSRSIQRMLQPGRPQVLQMVFENDLQALSLLVMAYEKSQDSKPEEIQSMYLDGCVVVTANYPDDMQKLEAMIKKAKYGTIRDQMWQSASQKQDQRKYSYFAFDQIGAQPKENFLDIAQRAETLVDQRLLQHNSTFNALSTVITKTSAESCAEAIQDQQLIVLRGASDSNVKFHAEQNLLLVLAYRLRAGQVPNNLGIRGVKVACKACTAVLNAFNTAYQAVYHKSIGYLGDGQKKEDIAKLDLKKIFPDAGLDTNFGMFVAIYDEVLNPSRYTFTLNDSFERGRAAASIGKLSQNKRQTAQQALLDAYNATRAVSSIRVTVQGDHPVIISSQQAAEPDRNLSALLTALNVVHQQPQPVQTNTQPQQNQVRQRNVNQRNHQQNNQNNRQQNRNRQQQVVQNPNHQQQQQGTSYVTYGVGLLTGLGLMGLGYYYGINPLSYFQSKEDPSRQRQPGKSHLLKPPSGGGRK